MITKIVMNKVASYINETSLITSKKVNLIYGLNGTGKSTVSNYLSNPTDPVFSFCSIIGNDSSCDVLVYNQKFIDDNFYASDDLRGIFTLTKKILMQKKILNLLLMAQNYLKNKNQKMKALLILSI
jgi:wobble nucleotide-excising tRNase